MPEGPEVQIMVDCINEVLVEDRPLLPKLLGITFPSKSFSLLKNSSLEELNTSTGYEKFLRACRFGKWILLYFENSDFYIHNSLYGHIHLVKSEDYESHPHDRIIWSFGSFGLEATDHLIYRDSRCWGQLWYYHSRPSLFPPFIGKLGYDPLQGLIHHDTLRGTYENYPHKSLGEVLLKQELVSGIGNIYRSEICYSAGISPFRFIRDITTTREWMLLSRAMYSVLENAYIAGGSYSSELDHPRGKKSTASSLHKVYQKQGQNCSNTSCTAKIKVEMLAKRKVYYCPECQH